MYFLDHKTLKPECQLLTSTNKRANQLWTNDYKLELDFHKQSWIPQYFYPTRGKMQHFRIGNGKCIMIVISRSSNRKNTYQWKIHIFTYLNASTYTKFKVDTTVENIQSSKQRILTQEQ